MTMAIAHSRGWLDYEERVSRVLAGVRAGGQGADHRPPAPRAPGGTVRARRAHRSWPRRRPRSAGGRAGASEARVGARDAAGLSRHHAWLLRGRDPAPHRSAASEPGTVLPGRDRVAARTRRLHPAARVDPELAPGDHRAARTDRDAAGLRSAIHAGGHEPSLQHQPRAAGAPELPHDEQRVYARNLEVPSGGARRDRPGHCACVQRLRHRRTRAGIASGDAGLVGRARRFRRRAGSTTSA